jgi:type I restriction enzyme R subunit
MPEELEWQTRRERINKKLLSLNPAWKIIKFSPGLDLTSLTCHAVEEYPTANGPADYALFVKGKLLGILEAKKVTVSPQNVLEQAKRYASGITGGVGSWNGFGVPFLYASNGEIVWFLDTRTNRHVSRRIKNFHTPNAVFENFYRSPKEALAWFNANPILNIERLRYYQREAIDAIEKAVLRGKREMLVAMATGTGKTYMTVAQVYRLLESKLARRILFLVDRRALAAQAVREFSSFQTPKGNKFNQEYEVYSQSFRRGDLEEVPSSGGVDAKRTGWVFDPKALPSEYLTNPKESHTFVYVSTIQRMTINLFGRESIFESPLLGGVDAKRTGWVSDPEYDEDADWMDIPIHAFDLIIADECHRGYTAKETAVWRDLIDYFDAVKIGLTATPAPHSLSLFNEVVYRYTTERAVLDGYLVDYEPIQINSKVRLHGVFLKEGEHIELVDRQTGARKYDELEDERAYPSEDIERDITAPESNKMIIQEIAKYAFAHEQETGRFPKILIFAVNDLQHTSHADQIVRICREVFGQGDEFVQKITGNPNVDRPLQKIREFRNRPNPKIVVTVDMLSTGVDIPAIEFIVFMRPVKSRILWVQMLGRGTRLCPEINKTHFKIFDCFSGTLIKYFENTTDFAIEPPQKEPVSLATVIENIYQNVDREYYTKVLIKRLRRIENDVSGDAIEAFANFIPDGDLRKFTDELSVKIKKDFTVTMKLLRNPDFQYLLLNYPRARKLFTVAPEAGDEVSSEILIKVADKQYKPEDYLDKFEKFVRENRDRIQAMQIVLRRPKQWKTDALNELRDKLRENLFYEPLLQKAHEAVYHKSLADIISMVKHAVRTDEPIYTAEERVQRAMNKFMETSPLLRRGVRGEALKWLGYIKEHLEKNLTLGLDDFEYTPIFERHGGIRKAKSVFNDQLETLISELNFHVAA